MNIFGFRPFKGKFNLGNADDIPENQDGTLIGSVKQINNDLTDNGETFKFGYDSVNDQMGYYKKVAGADTFFPFKSTLAKVKIGEDSRSYGASDIQTKTYAIPQELQGKMTADNVVVHIVSTDCRGGYLFAKAYLTSITDTTVSVQAGNFHTVAGGTVSYEVWLYYVD